MLGKIKRFARIFRLRPSATDLLEIIYRLEPSADTDGIYQAARQKFEFSISTDKITGMLDMLESQNLVNHLEVEGVRLYYPSYRGMEILRESGVKRE